MCGVRDQPVGSTDDSSMTRKLSILTTARDLPTRNTTFAEAQLSKASSPACPGGNPQFIARQPNLGPSRTFAPDTHSGDRADRPGPPCARHRALAERSTVA